MIRISMRAFVPFIALLVGLCQPAAAQFTGPPPPVMSNAPENSPMTNMMYNMGTSMAMQSMIPMEANIAMRQALLDRRVRDAHLQFKPVDNSAFIEIFVAGAANQKDRTGAEVYNAAYFRSRLSDFEADSARFGLPVHDAVTACDYLYEAIYYAGFGAAVHDTAERQALRGKCRLMLSLQQSKGQLRTDTELAKYYAVAGISAGVLVWEYNHAQGKHDTARLAMLREDASYLFKAAADASLALYPTLHDFLCAGTVVRACDGLLAQERRYAN